MKSLSDVEKKKEKNLHVCTAGIGGERLSHMGYGMRSVMSEELYKEQGAVKVLDAECAWMRHIMEAVLAAAF